MFTDSDYIKLYEQEYLKGKTFNQLEKITGIKRYTISRKFKKLNLKLRETKFDYSKVNINAFDEWSEEMSYWLGFIAADGNLNSKYKTVQVIVNNKDHEHLIKLKNFLNLPDSCLSEYIRKSRGKDTKESRLYFTVNRLYDSIFDLGVIPKKSKIDINLMEKVPKNLRIYFIFGYFDGDGGFGFHNKDKTYTMSIVGNKKTIYAIRNDLCDIYGIPNISIYNVKKQGKETNLYKLECCRKDNFLIFVDIYSSVGSSLCLKRKLNICKYILENNKCVKCGDSMMKIGKDIICNNCRESKRKVIERPTKELLEHLIKIKSFLSIGKTYGVSGNTIKKWCKDYGLPYLVKDIKDIYGVSKKGVYKEASLDKQRNMYLKTKSGFKGVGYKKGLKKPFSVNLIVDGKYKFFGYYEDAKFAAEKADELILKYHGNNAITNKKMGLI